MLTWSPDPSSNVREFVDRIAGVAPDPRVTENPWKNTARKAHLRRYLEYLHEAPPQYALIAEAPGYKGCVLSGIPLTDLRELNNPENEQLLGKWEREIGCAPGESCEITASAVWKEVRRRNAGVLLWNAFPFHPHMTGAKRTNRTPDTGELNFGGRVAADILQLYRIPRERVFAVGRKAQAVLNLSEEQYLRHPANGGQRLFAEHFALRIDPVIQC